MPTASFDYVDAVALHSAGLVSAARGNLGAPVEHCPGWSVADLVDHLTEVHWFWATIAEERLAEPPDESRRPARPAESGLLDACEAGAERLTRVLRAARYDDPVWTWSPIQRDVGFIARHQVQEAAVHHWDAAHAAGETVAIEPVVAADCIAECLTFSIPTAADPLPTPMPALDGRFALRCDDADASWTIADGDRPDVLAVTPGDAAEVPAITATATELLLWLYERLELDTAEVDPGVLERFRALRFDD
jgi:uncharacterized protein (TIGR03083 family)